MQNHMPLASFRTHFSLLALLNAASQKSKSSRYNLLNLQGIIYSCSAIYSEDQFYIRSADPFTVKLAPAHLRRRHIAEKRSL